MKEREIERLLLDHGASLVGFSALGEKACDRYPQYTCAVTIVRKLSDAIVETIDGRPTIAYFQHYRITNTKLDLLALDAVDFIESAGYRALPIAASQSTSEDKEAYRGLFSHKIGAVLSGLGFVGKNGLLITPEYGSKIRLCTVLTDMPLAPLRERIENGCGDCTACRDACPAGAIRGEAYIPGNPRETILDAKACSDHMKTYHDVGRGAVCGICMRVCPYNRK
ncbi:MAG: epoxyqueuosine reductase [Ruminococcus sp.]|nr:epoxyqueuosine reductase [Candidatus Apopatosoma intestinale]